ncbi:transposase, partial [Blautia sp. HA2174]
IAISNHRIICMDDENVTFSVKDYRNKGQWKELTLSGVEFMRVITKKISCESDKRISFMRKIVLVSVKQR